MKILVFLCVVSPCFVSPSVGAMPTDVERDKLRGTVEQIISGNCGKNDEVLNRNKEIVNYNPEGFRIDPEKDRNWNSEYDDKGRLKKRKLPSMGRVVSEEGYSYKPDGGITLVVKKYYPELPNYGAAKTDTITYHYDPTNVLFKDERMSFSFEEVLPDYVVYTRYVYNKKGEKVEEIQSNGKGVLLSKTVYQYKFNPIGKRIDTKEYGPEGKLRATNRETQDHYGNPISDGILERFFPDGTSVKSDGALKDYTYDAKGNWTKRVKQVNHPKGHLLANKICREITYY